jgi:hypothetical protein
MIDNSITHSFFGEIPKSAYLLQAASSANFLLFISTSEGGIASKDSNQNHCGAIPIGGLIYLK